MTAALKKPFLILGSNGQLGRELVYVCEQRRLARAHTRRQAGCGARVLELACAQDFEALLQEVAPCCVINAAAYTAVDAAENDQARAWQVNAEAPGRLAQACHQQLIPLVHFSTDYVFSGHQHRAYREDDECQPLNIYGQSKAEGERRILQHGGCHYVFRSSWLYAPGRPNFVTTMLRLFAGNRPVRVVDDQIGSPTWTRPLAQALIGWLERGLAQPQTLAANAGIYHLCARGATSWHGFAGAIAAAARPQPRQRPQPIPSSDYPAAASRPAYSVLDCTRAENRLGLRLPHWREQIDAAMPLFNSARTGEPA